MLTNRLIKRLQPFQRQAKSRDKLADAVASYVNLRSADGSHNAVVRTNDRLGRKVIVFVELNIISDDR